MTDREMVELAAKAAGLKIEFMHEMHPIAFLDHDSDWPRSMFNPLFDDGDAFRLSVRLKLSVLHDESLDGAPVVMVDENPYADHLDEYVCAPCSLGATRRAIVRAAAEIGKQMP